MIDSADKSLPIQNISLATTDKLDQQKNGRRRPGGYRKTKKKWLKLMLNF